MDKYAIIRKVTRYTARFVTWGCLSIVAATAAVIIGTAAGFSAIVSLMVVGGVFALIDIVMMVRLLCICKEKQ